MTVPAKQNLQNETLKGWISIYVNYTAINLSKYSDNVINLQEYKNMSVQKNKNTLKYF